MHLMLPVLVLALSPLLAPDSRALRAADIQLVTEWHHSTLSVVPADVLARICTELLEDGPELPQNERFQIILRRAELRSRLKQYDAAIADFDAALRLRPDDLDARAGRTFVLLHNRRYQDEARREAKDLMTNFPTEPDGHLLIAAYYVILETYLSAAEAYTDAIRCNPSGANGYFYRASCYYKLGEYHKSLADLDAVLRLAPSPATATTKVPHVRGMVLVQLGRYADAVAIFTELYRNEPKSIDFGVNLWLAAALDGKYGTCYYVARELREAHPDNVGVKRFFALSAAHFGQVDGALALYAGAEDPTRASLLVAERGRILFRAGRYSEAAKAFDESLRLLPDPDPVLRYALLLATCPDAELRNGERALSYAEQVLVPLRGSLLEADVLFIKAMALAELGRTADAVSAAEAAMAASPRPSLSTAVQEKLLATLKAGESVRHQSKAGTDEQYHIPVVLTVRAWSKAAKE